MTYWYWLGLALVVQLACPILNPKGYQKGKWLTMPLRRRVKWFDTSWCRTKQIWSLLAVNTVADIFNPHASYLFFLAIILLFLDDYLTNDDNLKKWWMAVRNKIKWKMELPQPVKVKG